jgi:hypothetical protein
VRLAIALEAAGRMLRSPLVGTTALTSRNGAKSFWPLRTTRMRPAFSMTDRRSVASFAGTIPSGD